MQGPEIAGPPDPRMQAPVSAGSAGMFSMPAGFDRASPTAQRAAIDDFRMIHGEYTKRRAMEENQRVKQETAKAYEPIVRQQFQGEDLPAALAMLDMYVGDPRMTSDQLEGNLRQLRQDAAARAHRGQVEAEQGATKAATLNELGQGVDMMDPNLGNASLSYLEDLAKSRRSVGEWDRRREMTNASAMDAESRRASEWDRRQGVTNENALARQNAREDRIDRRNLSKERKPPNIDNDPEYKRLKANVDAWEREFNNQQRLVSGGAFENQPNVNEALRSLHASEDALDAYMRDFSRKNVAPAGSTNSQPPAGSGGGDAIDQLIQQLTPEQLRKLLGGNTP